MAHINILYLFVLLLLLTACNKLNKQTAYTSIYEASQSADDVESLDLSGQELEHFPESLHIFKNLKQLDLDENNITDFSVLAQLTELEVLSIRKNGLTAIPPAICQLKQLRELNLNGNAITNFSLLSCLSGSLKELKIAGNNLSQIPTEIAQLPKLKRLDLSKNNLSAEDLSVLQPLQKLEELKLKGMGFKARPTALKDMENLTEVDL